MTLAQRFLHSERKILQDVLSWSKNTLACKSSLISSKVMKQLSWFHRTICAFCYWQSLAANFPLKSSGQTKLSLHLWKNGTNCPMQGQLSFSMSRWQKKAIKETEKPLKLQLTQSYQTPESNCYRMNCKTEIVCYTLIHCSFHS